MLSVLDNAEEALQDAAKVRYKINSLLEGLLGAAHCSAGTPTGVYVAVSAM